jgi:hypothetical protein
MFSTVVQIMYLRVYNGEFGHHCFLSRPSLQLPFLFTADLGEGLSSFTR